MRVDSNANKLAVQWKNTDNLISKKHLHSKVRDEARAEWEVIQEKRIGEESGVRSWKYFCSYSRM